MGPVTETIREQDAQAGSRSVFIVPMKSGNRAHWDPREERETSRGENR